MRSNITLFLLLISIHSWGQELTNTLSTTQLISIVQNFHPLARQLKIGIEKSDAGIIGARAAFDPILSHYTSQKTLDGKNYYQIQSPELKIPTWYGIELYAGIDNLSGTRIDPSQTIGQTGYLGISIPLAKNLLIDKRRAILKQSFLFNKMAKEEQRAQINLLLTEALLDYWNWAKTYRTVEIVKNSLNLAIKRMEIVKRSFQLGERPAIDTLEALTQKQFFENLLATKKLEFQNAGFELSIFLWDEQRNGFQLTENIVPEKSWENNIDIQNINLDLPSLLKIAAENHPELAVYQIKLSSLEIDKQLKFQSLLPKIDFNYNQLSNNQSFNQSSALFDKNFAYGFKLEIPLRLSEGRSEFKTAKLKIEEQGLNFDQKKRSIELKIRGYHNELINLKAQISIQENAVKNYIQLVQAEETRFFNGESSLFLINTRETKALEAQEKLIELKTKYFKTIYALQGSAGILG